jgi:hypothetical protein
MSGFLRELQDVYVEGYGGDITYPPIMARGQKVPVRSDTSYYGLPGTQPGQGNPSMPTVDIPYEAEEESTISKSLLTNYIADMLETKGHQTAMEALIDLLIFIKKN